MNLFFKTSFFFMAVLSMSNSIQADPANNPEVARGDFRGGGGGESGGESNRGFDNRGFNNNNETHPAMRYDTYEHGYNQGEQNANEYNNAVPYYIPTSGNQNSSNNSGQQQQQQQPQYQQNYPNYNYQYQQNQYPQQYQQQQYQYQQNNPNVQQGGSTQWYPPN